MKHNDAEFINDLKKVTKQGGIFFGGSSVELFLRYLYSIILARALGAASVGIYFLGFTIVNFVSLIARFEMQEGVLKFVSSLKVSGDEDEEKAIVFSAVKVTLVSSILVCAVMLAIANPLAGKIFKEPLLARVIMSFLISIPFMSVLAVFLSYFQAKMRMKYHVLTRSIVQPSVNILIFMVVFLSGGRLLGAVFSYAVSIVLTLLLSVYFMNKNFRLFDARKARLSGQTGAPLLRFSLPLVLAAILHFAIQWTDTVLLGYFRNATEVGVYSIAVRTASLCTVVFVAFTSAFAPMISDFYERKKIGSLEALFKLLTKWIVILTLPLLITIILFSGDILRIFGREFFGGKGALTILCLGQLFNIGTGSVYYIILMTGRSKVVLINSAIICFLNLILDLILIPGYGLLGAAVANACSLIIFNVLMLIEVYCFLRIHPYDHRFIKPLIASGFSVAVFYLFRMPFSGLGFPISMISLGALFIICYVTALCILKLDTEDRMILGLLKNRLILGRIKHD